MKMARPVLVAAGILLTLSLASLFALPVAPAVVPPDTQASHAAHAAAADGGLVSIVQTVTRP